MNVFSPSAVFLLAGLLAGCAAKAPPELLHARQANEAARESLAATLVPAELHKANDALAVAEAAFAKDPRGYHTADLAYVAHRKSQLAQVLAVSKSQESRADQADAQLQANQDTVMRVAKADLATSEKRLEASEEARIRAEAKMVEAMDALAALAVVKQEARGVVITLQGGVLFTSEQATLLPEAQDRLLGMTTALLAASDRTILIEGHTDSKGTDAYNLDLSQRRADAVRNFMSTHGYDVSHTRAVGIGEARPVASNETDDGRAQNRRVEVVIENLTASAR